MKVKELVAVLQKMPQDVEILKRTSDGSYPIKWVETEWAHYHPDMDSWWMLFNPEIPDLEDDPPRQQVVTL